MARYDVLFAIMAVWEVRFFGEAARRLRDEEGLSVGFITFHEAGDDLLGEMGIDCFSLHKLKDRYLQDARSVTPAQAGRDFGISDLRDVYRHEMLKTNRGDAAWHARKTIAYLRLLDDIVREHDVGCIVQELGGFIAPLSLYHVARRRGIPHVFIEPSIFNRQLLFTLDSLYCELPADVPARTEPDPALLEYLAGLRARGAVVMPHKDRHSFHSMALRKIFSLDNLRRLARKLYHKYVLRRAEEYNAIGWHVTHHLQRWVRTKLLSSCYQQPVPGEPYLFYPFHVPLDVQLTVRSPECLDQEGMVARLAEALPPGVMLYVKEHPASIGAHSPARLKRALRSGRVRLIHPGVGSYDLIRNARAVVTVNSKVGMEALIQEKPVLVLGRAYYRGHGLTVDADVAGDLSDAVRRVLAWRPDPRAVRAFLDRVWQWSHPGELFEFSEANRNTFYDSLRRYLRHRVPSLSVTARGRDTPPARGRSGAGMAAR